MMKKVMLFAGAFVMLGLVSCKKDYECCFYEGGEKVESASIPCVSGKMSKKDAEASEEASKAAATSLGGEFKCEKK